MRDTATSAPLRIVVVMIAALSCRNSRYTAAGFTVIREGKLPRRGVRGRIPDKVYDPKAYTKKPGTRPVLRRPWATGCRANPRGPVNDEPSLPAGCGPGDN